MRFCKTIQVIDTHTGGQPTRTVVGGVPVIPGSTMEEKYLYLQEHYQWLNDLLSREPRGSSFMAGAILTPPCSPKADIGVVYYESGNWMPMCGHNTIGVATALIESGMIEAKEPGTDINLDTPSGVIQIRVQIEDGHAGNVSFVNVPSFVMAHDCSVETKEFGTINYSVAWGGNVYALVEAEQFGLEIVPENAKKLVAAGILIRDCINRNTKIRHPLLPFVDSVTHVEFSAPSATPGVDRKNTVLVTSPDLDRSACGTGSSAKLALLHLEGKLAPGEKFVHESIIGSIFECRIIGETMVGDIPAVIPEISGRAWVTGLNTFVLDPTDPFPRGFELV